MDRKRLHLIYNAMSGAFVRGLEVSELRNTIGAAGWTISSETNLETEALTDLASLEGSDVDAVAIAGGDGTIMSVLNVLARREAVPPALILPCGTANLLARYVHGTVETEAILTSARAADTKPLPLGDANGQLFAVAAAVGVSPALVRFREDIRKRGFVGRMRRSLAYFVVGSRSLFERPFLTQIHGEASPRRSTAIYVTCPDRLDENGQFRVFGGRMKNVADLVGGLAMAAVPGVEAAGPNWITETVRLDAKSSRPLPVILDGEPHVFDSPVTLVFGEKCVEVIAA